MQRLKKILLFVIGSFVVPFVAVFITNILFWGIDFFETNLLAALWGSYIIAYIFTPMLYSKGINKYISNRYVLFAIIFGILWIIEILIKLI